MKELISLFILSKWSSTIQYLHMDFCTSHPLPPWKYAVVCQCLFPHCTWHASFRVCPSPPEKFWIDTEWLETARNRRKKICHLVTPTRKKLRKISIIAEIFFFRDFQFSRRFRWFWTTFKKFLKINFENFSKFFSGGGHQGAKIFFSISRRIRPFWVDSDFFRFFAKSIR